MSVSPDGFELSPGFLGLLLLLFLMSVLITSVIANKIGRAFTPVFRKWVYAFVSLIPFRELIVLETGPGIHLGDPFFWFWAAFFCFCCVMFIRSFKLKGESTE